MARELASTIPHKIEGRGDTKGKGRDDDKEEHHDGYGENGDDVATGGMRRLHMRSSRQRSVEDRQKWICSESNSSLISLREMVDR